MSVDAEWVDRLAALQFRDLPSGAVAASQAALLDHFACGMVGMRTPWIASLRETVRAETGAGDHAARVYGEVAAVPPGVAALVNGSAAHALEMDDVYLPALVHPGSVVCAAIVAAAAEVDAPGPEVLAALTAGYQAIVSIGSSLSTAHNDLGFHSTGVHGPIAAAVASKWSGL